MPQLVVLKRNGVHQAALLQAPADDSMSQNVTPEVGFGLARARE